VPSPPLKSAAVGQLLADDDEELAEDVLDEVLELSTTVVLLFTVALTFGLQAESKIKDKATR
jgi:hypothetical protein